jgi:hypothetical protein
MPITIGAIGIGNTFLTYLEAMLGKNSTDSLQK